MNKNRTQDPRSGDRNREESPGKRPSGYRNEVGMGLAVILTVLLVYFGVKFLEGENFFKGTYALFAEFESAGGLSEGSSVRISGMTVGEIADIRLKDGSRGVVVRMEIDDGVEVPAGSVASVGGISALDNASIDIAPGMANRPLLAHGDTVQTRDGGDLLGQVDSALNQARRTFSNAGSLVESTERDLGLILQQMQSASGDAAVLMDDSRGRIQATLLELQTAATDLNRFAARMDSVAVNLDQTTGTGGDTLVAAVNRLNELMQRLDGVVASLERGSTDLELVAARMNSDEGTFGRLVSDPSLYTRLDSAAMNLNEILSEFKSDPKKYLEHLELVDVF